jgi:hypothetical protein
MPPPALIASAMKILPAVAALRHVVRTAGNDEAGEARGMGNRDPVAKRSQLVHCRRNTL